MPAAVRLDDFCTGHGCWGGRTNSSGSPDTFINDKAAHRKSDSYVSHSCPPAPPHGSILASGSPDTFVNDLDQGRVGDPVACGSSCASGSPDTFVN